MESAVPSLLGPAGGRWPQRCLGTDPAMWLQQVGEEGLDLQPSFLMTHYVSMGQARPLCLSLPLYHVPCAGIYTRFAFVPVLCP